MNILFFAFANSQTDALPTLQKEFEDVKDILSPRARRQHFFPDWEPFASTQKIARAIIDNREQLFLFHYGGHAGRDSLVLTDQAARSEGVAQLLSQCPQLRIVVLNGCSTQGQVEQLLEAGVPVVIATSAPVGDEQATNFSRALYQSLERGETIGQSFDAALAAAKLTSEVEAHRGLALRGQAADKPLWGIFYKEERKSVLDEKLPSQSAVAVPTDYKPNNQLRETLFKALAPYNKKIAFLLSEEADNNPVEEGEKDVQILNALPIPVAEHLRKLMCPVENENDGYDKPSLRRLEQITTVYQMSMELLAYTMISQLWETVLSVPDQTAEPLPDELKERLRAFFGMSTEDRKTYDYIPLIRAVRLFFDSQKVAYFVEELDHLREQIQNQAPFAHACQYLHFLRQQVARGSIAEHEIVEMCSRAEQNLCMFLEQLAFLSRYTLASVKTIDIRKYRHQRKATFNHALVKLMRVMGRLEVNSYVLQQYTDNRGVLMIKEETQVNYVKDRGEYQGEGLRFLNLSPFIIDQNAFEENTDISKLYFFDRFDVGADRCYYRHVKKPNEDRPLEVMAASKYDMVKEQFDAFQQLVL